MQTRFYDQLITKSSLEKITGDKKIEQSHMLKSWNTRYDLVLPGFFKPRKNNKPSGNLCHSPTYIWGQAYM